MYIEALLHIDSCRSARKRATDEVMMGKWGIIGNYRRTLRTIERSGTVGRSPEGPVNAIHLDGWSHGYLSGSLALRVSRGLDDSDFPFATYLSRSL